MTIDHGDREIDELLHHLDHDPPDVRAEDIMRRASLRGARWRRAAAILVLGSAAAGIAYALPGSPLPGWIGARQPEPAADPPSDAPVPPAGAAGIAIDVTDSLRVDVTGALTDALVIVSLLEEAQLTVSAPGGSAGFRSEPQRLVIELLRPDTVRIGVPAGAARIDISARGRLLFRMRDTTPNAAVARGADGTWRIPLDEGVTNR